MPVPRGARALLLRHAGPPLQQRSQACASEQAHDLSGKEHPHGEDRGRRAADGRIHARALRSRRRREGRAAVFRLHPRGLDRPGRRLSGARDDTPARRRIPPDRPFRPAPQPLRRMAQRELGRGSSRLCARGGSDAPHRFRSLPGPPPPHRRRRPRDPSQRGVRGPDLRALRGLSRRDGLARARFRPSPRSREPEERMDQRLGLLDRRLHTRERRRTHPVREGRRLPHDAPLLHLPLPGTRRICPERQLRLAGRIPGKT